MRKRSYRPRSLATSPATWSGLVIGLRGAFHLARKRKTRSQATSSEPSESAGAATWEGTLHYRYYFF